MKRTFVTRCFAAAVLVSIAALLALAVAQLVLGVGIDDAVRRGADLLAARSGNINIDQSLRLRAYPGVIISAGSISTDRTGAQRGATLNLQSPVIDILVGERADQNVQTVNWLADTLGNVSDVDKIALRRASVTFRWADGKSWTVSDLDAEISGKNTSALTISGHFSYLGQRLKFDISSPGRVETHPPSPAGARWPLKVVITSPLLGVTMDGELDTRTAWCIKAMTELRTPDATLLASWLGYGWANLGPGSGSGFLIRGAATWDKGAITFGKSQVSLGDQNGIGALSLSYRDERPVIEATAAFPALDVAPLFYVAAPDLLPKSAALVSLRPPSAPAASATWRGLTTSFPAAAKIDTELRLSAGRLQWRGEPIGQGAFSVSARRGVVHADFSELTIGGHSGSLQIQMDGTSPNAPVTLRGRIKSIDIGELAAAAFGATPVTGPGATQFELAGHGTTLGELVDHASGRGSIEAPEGTIKIDANALKRLVSTLSVKTQQLTWNALHGSSAFQNLGLKFQLRNGTALLENGTLRSDGLVASITGRVDFAGAALDLQAQFSSDHKPQRPVRRVSGGGLISDDIFSISGAWMAPLISLSLPPVLP